MDIGNNEITILFTPIRLLTAFFAVICFVGQEEHLAGASVACQGASRCSSVHFFQVANKLKKIRFPLVLVGPFCFLLIFSELFAQITHLTV